MTEVLIEAKKLTKCYEEKQALDNFSLEIHKGSVHAFIGANGAGKTTFFRIMLGLLSPTSGSCSILGYDSQHLTPRARGLAWLLFVAPTVTASSVISVDGASEIHQAMAKQ